ncbi:hypothetical protein LPJ73_008182, partial [Coemansia sp. RSA 2703]
KVVTSVYNSWNKEPEFEAIVDQGSDPNEDAPNDEAIPTTVVHVMSPAKHIGITIGLMLLSYIVAMTVSSLDLVLSFVGSTGSTCISFILPGVFYYKMHRVSRWTRMK